MKKVFYSAMVAVLGMFLFASCGGSADVEKEIIGEWKVVSVDLSGMEDMIVQLAQQLGVTGDDLEAMKKEMNDEMAKEFNDEVLNFKEDYTVSMSDGEDATWKYDADNKKIVISTPDGQTIDFVIESLKGDKLSAQFVAAQGGMELKIGMELERK